MFRHLILITGLSSETLNYSCKRNIALSAICHNKKIIKAYPKLVTNHILQKPGHEETLEDSLFNSLNGKVVYNSLVTKKNSITRWKLRKERWLKKQENVRKSSVPLSLRYYYNEFELGSGIYDTLNEEGTDVIENECGDVYMPYSIAKKIDIQSDTDSNVNYDSDKLLNKKKVFLPEHDVEPPQTRGKKWMSDYECYEEEDEGEEIELPEIDYGTPDPNVPASNVPCGGCGAHLHCQNSSIPGYLPCELYKQCSKEELHSVICQRCTFLKQYNTALAVTVDQESYPKLIEIIKNKNALIVLLVDMTDFPCSIWPRMFELIGNDKPVILVGNKIDLIPGDSPGWLKHAKQVLKEALPKNLNILHVALISAKNGYGIEELIDKLHSLWRTDGDVYLLGCTNVGKSTLFNDLLNSDYCKVQAIDLIQRATTSPWPGTTLNLLKFPILRLSAWRAFTRSRRLRGERHQQMMENKFKQYECEFTREKFQRLPQIIGRIGLTFKKVNGESFDQKNVESEFTMPTTLPKKEEPKKRLNENDRVFKLSKWCYDTPGVVHPDQIINLLTTTELLRTLPSKIITPRIFSIYPKQTLFIGGLARIDILSCEIKFPRVIIYASDALPITLCQTEFADEVYNTLVGTSYMGVPYGSLNRLRNFPLLKFVQDFEIIGESHAVAVSDIVLSSVGWISITAAYKKKAIIRPWTPDGKGIHLRKTPLLLFTAGLRRKRLYNTPTYITAQAP